MRTMKEICAKETERKGISLTMIGYWSDLIAYYAGSDGNVWAYSNGAGYGGNWANEGPINEFVSTFNGTRRGQLLN